MEIREANHKDSKEISILITALTKKYVTSEYPENTASNLLNSMSESEIEKKFLHGYIYFVAVINNQIVGVIGIKQKCHIIHLFVSENHQKQGIARQLLNITIEAFSKMNDINRFTVNSSTYAKNIYKRLGFITQSEPEARNGVTSIAMTLVLNN